MPDDVTAPSAPATTEPQPIAVAPASPQGDTPAGAPGVTNSSRQARPLPEETRREFFAGQPPALPPASQPQTPAAAPLPPPPVRPDLDDEDLEFKINLTIIGRSGELASRAVTIPCAGGLGRGNAGTLLNARETATAQLQMLLRRMLDKLQADTKQLVEEPPLMMAPGPSAIASLAAEPVATAGETEELIPRT